MSARPATEPMIDLSLTRRCRGALAACAALAVLASSPFPASSEPDDTEDRSSRLQEEILEATKEEAALLEELSLLGEEEERLGGELATLEAEVADTALRLVAAEREVERAEGRLAAVTDRLQRTNERLAGAIDVLQDQAVDAFVTGGGSGPMSREGGPAVEDYAVTDGYQEVGAAHAYADAVVEHQRDVVDRVDALRDEVRRLASAATAARDDAIAAREAAESRRAEVIAARDATSARRAQTEQATGERERLLDEVRERRAAYEARLAALAAVSSSITDLLRRQQAGQSVVGAVPGLLTHPLPGAPMSSRFGPRVHPIYGTVRLHAGLDLSAPSGSPILAAADGVVVAAGRQGGYGNTVVIDHGSGIATLYAHQSLVAVEVGTAVAQGDVIGAVGSTGASTGPHLHFEVRLLGTPVDPLAYLGAPQGQTVDAGQRGPELSTSG